MKFGESVKALKFLLSFKTDTFQASHFAVIFYRVVHGRNDVAEEGVNDFVTTVLTLLQY